MMNKKVTVVIITYNRSIDVLKKAVQSVLTQTYKEFELFIVNDAPENINLADEIKQYIAELGDTRVTYLSYEKNGGSNYARNYGYVHATGEYIAFLDDDDEWLPKKLEYQVKEMDKNDRIGLVSCGFYMYKNEKLLGTKEIDNKKNLDIKSLLLENYVGGTSFPLLRKSALDDVGAFDIKMKSCQEYELWIRIRKKYDFATINLPLGIYNDIGDSIYKGNNTRYYEGILRLLTKHQELYSRFPNIHNEVINDMELYFLRYRNYKLYRRCKKEAIKIKFNSPYNFTIVQILIRIKKYLRK